MLFLLEVCHFGLELIDASFLDGQDLLLLLELSVHVL